MSFVQKIEQILGLSIKVFILTSLMVILFGVYVTNLIYGNTSLKIVKRLESERAMLIQEIEVLKQENATLHKHYLEWKDAKE